MNNLRMLQIAIHGLKDQDLQDSEVLEMVRKVLEGEEIEG